MTKRRTWAALAAAAAVSCGKSSSSPPATTTPPPTTTTTNAVTGIALPKEVSALPPKSSTSSALHTLTRALTASPPAGSDYANAQTVKYVDEHALAQFDIFNTIFAAVAQTHYADAGNVDAGPYGAVVDWVENKGDQAKQVVPWVVDSKMITVDGHDVNRLQVWMLMNTGDQPGLTLVKVQMDIREAPTQLADGTYSDYGVWRLDANLGDGVHTFSATAEHAVDGTSIVKLHEVSGHDGDTSGILVRSDTSGYGKVAYVEQSCPNGVCTATPVTVSYVYDANDVAVQREGDQPKFKDRNGVVDLVNRYGLFDADTGEDVAKAHKFGFPIRYADPQGNALWGYYGAWQGRHQVWAGGQPLDPNVTVTRADLGPNDPVESYTTTKVYEGILVKRTYVDAQLSDIKGVVVNAWDFQSYGLQSDGSGAWYRCTMPMQMPGQPWQPPQCDSTPFTDFASLVATPPTSINISSCSGGGMNSPPACQNLSVALTLDGLVDGSGTPFVPPQGAMANVNVGGPIWIVYDGTGWVKKQVLSVDSYNQPTFGSGDAAYAIPDGREFYLDNMGVNYVVQCQSGACTAKLEVQSVANPVNVATFVPAGTVFTQQSWGQTPSTFSFVTDPADPSFMKLVYATVGAQDATTGAQVGQTVTSGQWGLTASISGQTVQFNWEYPDAQNQCTNCGVQQFLAKDGGIVLLDAPVRFAAVQLADGAGVTHTFSLQFDGSWVSGLPDVYNDLGNNHYDMTQAIADKVVGIPAGTVFTDASDATKHYVFKPLQVSEYLEPIADPHDLDLTAATALDLATVPTFVDGGMGPRPDVPVKYSEGNPVH